jgi:hypothetical protein
LRSRNCSRNYAQDDVGFCDLSRPERISIGELVKSTSFGVSLNEPRRSYVDTVVCGRARTGENDGGIMTEPFEHTFIAPKQVRFRSIAKRIFERQERSPRESLLQTRSIPR